MPLGFKIPEDVDYLIRILEENGYEAYVVGGCVRDSFLGRIPHDWDICTDAEPQEVIDLLGCYGIQTIETGLKHGTVTAHLKNENYEITTYRIDGEYSDNRRPNSVEFVNDIEQDLSRRDFTINAMAYSNICTVIDPFDGYEDLGRKLIRCVGNPDDRFREDALRIMRALRFAATYGFKIEEETAAAIHRNKELLKNISAERIQSELCKMLCGEGILDILLEYKDVMAVIIPEFEPCIGFNQNNPYHMYDVYDHIAHAVAGYKGNDISVKVALLLHDIGKPECYTEDHNGGHFHGHSVPSMRIARDVVERLRFDNKTRDEVIDLVLYHDSDIYPGVRSVKRWLNKIGYEMLCKLMQVRLADICAHSSINRASRADKCYTIIEIAKEIVDQQQCFQLKDLAINGYDIMALGVPSGPDVGCVLDWLLCQVLDEEVTNEHDALVEEATRYIERALYEYVIIDGEKLKYEREGDCIINLPDRFPTAEEYLGSIDISRELELLKAHGCDIKED